MYYLATVDPSGHIVEICHHTRKETMDKEAAEIGLTMLSEFKTHTSWEELKKRGFKIIKLQEMA